MAISPQTLNEAFINQVNEFEKKIDESLSKKIATKGQTVSIQVPQGMSYVHFNEIQKRYQNAGWVEVRYNSDQREGTWLSFKF